MATGDGTNYPTNQDMTADIPVLLSQIVGGGNGEELVDISSTDHTATMTDCRFLTCIDGTVVKMDYLDDDGVTTVTTIWPAEPRIIPQRNITKIYKTGTDATVSIYLRR